MLKIIEFSTKKIYSTVNALLKVMSVHCLKCVNKKA